MDTRAIFVCNKTRYQLIIQHQALKSQSQRILLIIIHQRGKKKGLFMFFLFGGISYKQWSIPLAQEELHLPEQIYPYSVCALS
jgi:hypothetical protein